MLQNYNKQYADNSKTIFIIYYIAFCFIGYIFYCSVQILKIENRRGVSGKWYVVGGVVVAATPDCTCINHPQIVYE